MHTSKVRVAEKHFFCQISWIRIKGIVIKNFIAATYFIGLFRFKRRYAFENRYMFYISSKFAKAHWHLDKVHLGMHLAKSHCCYWTLVSLNALKVEEITAKVAKATFKVKAKTCYKPCRNRLPLSSAVLLPAYLLISTNYLCISFSGAKKNGCENFFFFHFFSGKWLTVIIVVIPKHIHILITDFSS